MGNQNATLPEDAYLDRDTFRETCLERDGGRCVICGEVAADVHHIIERRLFTDPGEEGGYFTANGASVCERHHIAAEQTRLSPEELRRAAGIEKVIVPAHLYEDGSEAGSRLGKWGDYLLADGFSRSPGELFSDPSVQRILREGGVLERYIAHLRYPRTYHVPFSLGVGPDDRVLADLSSFEGCRIVVSIKRDGENTSIYADGFIHARSPDGLAHPSQSRVRALAARVAYELPAGWRICGENLQAKHAILYHHLPAYFLLISVWNERNECLSWDQTIEWAALLDLPTVEVIYDGPFDETILHSLHRSTDATGDEIEGWVMRRTDGFAYRDFRANVAKFVRAGHVPTHALHWRRGPLVENELDPGV